MPSVLVALYWLWLLGALAVIAYRVVGRVRGTRNRVFEFRSRTETEGDSEEPARSVAAPALAAMGRATTTAPDVAGAGAGGDGDEPAHEIEPAVLAAMREDAPEAGARPEPPDTIPSATGSGGLFSAEARAAHEDVPVGACAPLTETLDGISMPCDLVPMTDLGPRPPRETHRERLVLTTAGAGAGEVAARLADELERLGLDVTPTGAAGCLARRRDHAVEVRVHEFADQAVVDGVPMFPNAQPDSVVVELISA